MRKPCGFAAMTPEQRIRIAGMGGRAAQAKGTAHKFDSAEGRAAGQKGGVSVSRNREHMARIGRRGGEARGRSRKQQGSEALLDDAVREGILS